MEGCGMIDLANPKAFSAEYEKANNTTRTDNPEQIRNAMHEPEPEARPSIYPYVLVRGELTKVESDDE